MSEEIATAKIMEYAILKEAFLAGWNTRSQIVRYGTAKGAEDVFDAWLAQRARKASKDE